MGYWQGIVGCETPAQAALKSCACPIPCQVFKAMLGRICRPWSSGRRSNPQHWAKNWVIFGVHSNPNQIVILVRYREKFFP